MVQTHSQGYNNQVHVMHQPNHYGSGFNHHPEPHIHINVDDGPHYGHHHHQEHIHINVDEGPNYGHHHHEQHMRIHIED